METGPETSQDRKPGSQHGITRMCQSTHIAAVAVSDQVLTLHARTDQDEHRAQNQICIPFNTPGSSAEKNTNDKIPLFLSSCPTSTDQRCCNSIEDPAGVLEVQSEAT